MKRLSAFTCALLLLLAACSGGGEPTTIVSTTSSTTTSTTSSTTTTVPLPTITVDGADSDLAGTIEALYGVAFGGDEPAADAAVLSAFRGASGNPPATATATVGDWSEDVRLAVVEADQDVTLAVADPTWRVIGGWWPSMRIDPELGTFPKIVAVIGSDARPNQNRERARSDSIHFVAMAGDGTASIVGVPRDSWVAISGHGHNKINAALAFGGPDLMMQTFSDVTGLDLDGFILTGFAGFQSLIGVLDGLRIDVPHAFNDKAAKAYLDAGRQILNGAQALAMSRARKTLARGDFSRQENGGLVIEAAQAMVRAGGASGLPGLISAAQPYFSTSFSPDELLRVAAAITRVDPDQVINEVAPGRVGSAGGASVVFLTDAAPDLFADLADGHLEPPG